MRLRLHRLRHLEEAQRRVGKPKITGTSIMLLGVISPTWASTAVTSTTPAGIGRRETSRRPDGCRPPRNS